MTLSLRAEFLIAAADSVTQVKDIRGQVLVAGSHGGIVAAWYAAKAGVRAVILNDAGIGKDEAGVAGLRWLEAIGMAAAALIPLRHACVSFLRSLAMTRPYACLLLLSRASKFLCIGKAGIASAMRSGVSTPSEW